MPKPRSGQRGERRLVVVQQDRLGDLELEPVASRPETATRLMTLCMTTAALLNLRVFANKVHAPATS